jgi:hypothetical protein
MSEVGVAVRDNCKDGSGYEPVKFKPQELKEKKSDKKVIGAGSSNFNPRFLFVIAGSG